MIVIDIYVLHIFSFIHTLRPNIMLLFVSAVSAVAMCHCAVHLQ